MPPERHSLSAHRAAQPQNRSGRPRKGIGTQSRQTSSPSDISIGFFTSLLIPYITRRLQRRHPPDYRPEYRSSDRCSTFSDAAEECCFTGIVE